MPSAPAGVEDRRALGDAHRLPVDVSSTALRRVDVDVMREHSEVHHRGLDGVRGGLAEAADRRVAHHLRELGEHRELVAVRLPGASRCSASSWRTVPTRHGTHWPHDSSRKNSAIRSTASTRSAPLVVDDHDAGAERRAGSARVLEGERQVELVGPQERAGGAAEQHRLRRPRLRELEQLAQRRRRTAPRRARAARRGPRRRRAACPSTLRCRSARTPPRCQTRRRAR